MLIGIASSSDELLQLNASDEILILWRHKAIISGQ